MDPGIFRKIVSAGITAKKADDALKDLGYTDTPYFQIYGNIADAVYAMLGETTETYEQSITYKIMCCPAMTDEQRNELLAILCNE